MTSAPRRSSDKREKTRAKLVEATLAVIAEKGFAAVNLQDIADQAGVTTGSIYSNFDGKADLLHAAINAKALTLTPILIPGAPLKDQLRAVAQAVIDILPQTQKEARFIRDFHLYALGDPELSAQRNERHAQAFQGVSDMLADAYGDTLLIPPRTLAVIIQSLALGLISQHQSTPREISDDVVIHAFDAVARAAVRRS